METQSHDTIFIVSVDRGRDVSMCQAYGYKVGFLVLLLQETKYLSCPISVTRLVRTKSWNIFLGWHFYLGQIDGDQVFFQFLFQLICLLLGEVSKRLKVIAKLSGGQVQSVSESSSVMLVFFLCYNNKSRWWSVLRLIYRCFSQIALFKFSV